MYKNLRIIFCILAVAAVAAAVFVFVYAGWVWGLIAVIAALVFAGLMFWCKSMQESEEKKNDPAPAERGDFITGKKDDGETR